MWTFSGPAQPARWYPPPPENFECSEYSGYSGCLGTSEYFEFPDYSEISEHSECSECSKHSEYSLATSGSCSGRRRAVRGARGAPRGGARPGLVLVLGFTPPKKFLGQFLGGPPKEAFLGCPSKTPLFWLDFCRRRSAPPAIQ